MKLKDLITRFVEQGLRLAAPPSSPTLRRRRSELPVARAATGRTLSSLTNADIDRIFEEEDIAHFARFGDVDLLHLGPN